jgi:uncharacterized protein YqgV (UPF0045/DUF77 family)
MNHPVILTRLETMFCIETIRFSHTRTGGCMLVDLQTTPLGRLRAVFRFKQLDNILIELSINPVECGTLSNEQLTQILQAIGDSRLGLFNETTSDGAEWDEVMTFARRWHEAVCTVLGHVITTLRIEEARVTSEASRGVAENSQRAPTAVLRMAAAAGGHSSDMERRRGRSH